ncbi:hypothetical protein MBLNU457_5755t2 [Dothideomycetes sp. NU457]
MSRFSEARLYFAYALDWLLIICIAAVGGGISAATPYHRPFSLLNLDLSYPNAPSQISTAVLVVVSLIAPAVIIAVIALAFFPPLSTRSQMKSGNFWRLKFWEFNAAWMGLGLSYVLAFFITQGIKNIFGKPRPDLLARCQPDLTNISQYVVGGYGQDISGRWTLVSSAICTQPDQSVLNEGFRSFLSGHASASWAGLLYLSLWLALKLNVSIPIIQPYANKDEDDSRESDLPIHRNAHHIRTSSSAPPIFGIVIILIPISVAIYICSTRWVDFKHHGFDIISGSILGILTAWFGFRMYHSSLTQGRTWTWAPRSTEDAFAISSGKAGWEDRMGMKSRRDNDVGSQEQGLTV